MVADRVEQLPLILDCFGNAATEGNANSSRHVRYLEMKFTDSGKLSGAIISLYLLEKWRISESLSKFVNILFYITRFSMHNGIVDPLGQTAISTSFTTSITD